MTTNDTEAGKPAPAAEPLALRLNDQLGLAPERATMRLTLADLGVLADTAERNGTMHAFPAVALQWAAGAQAEIERLRAALVNESRRVCGTESDCVLQPHCSHAQKCMRPEWDAKAELIVAGNRRACGTSG